MQGTYHLPASGLKATNRHNSWKESLKESKMIRRKTKGMLSWLDMIIKMANIRDGESLLLSILHQNTENNRVGWGSQREVNEGKYQEME